MIAEGHVTQDFRVERQLATGRFSRVWLAHDNITDQNVVLKVTDRESLKKREELSAYRHENTILKRADNPFIAQLYFDFEAKNEFISVYEYLPGGTLADLIAKKGPLEETLARKYFCELVVAVQYIHNDMQRVHGDLRSQKILLDQNGHVRIGDWVSSRILKASGSKVTYQNSFMSPEQVASGEMSETSDIWALGVILYHMVVGQEPFLVESQEETTRRIVTAEPEYPPTLSPLLVDFLKGILKKNMVMRFSIEGIKSHKWFSMTEFQAMTRLLDKKEIDKDVVTKMVTELGMDCSSVTQELQNGQMTRNTCMYAELKRKELVTIMSDVIAGKRVHASRRRTDEMRKTRKHSRGTTSDKDTDTEDDSTSAPIHPAKRDVKTITGRPQPRQKVIRIAARKSAHWSIGGRGGPLPQMDFD